MRGSGRPGRGGIVALASVTLLGAALRVWSPGRVALWGDEVQFLNISALPDLRSITGFLYAHESHPPLLYFVAHWAGQLTGAMPAVMSGLVLIASVALVPAAWWLGSLSGLRAAPAVSALLVAVAMPLVFLSVQVRPYSLVSLLLLISVGMVILESRTHALRWRATWAALALTLLYLHHIAVIVLAAEVLTITIAGWRGGAPGRAVRNWLPWLAFVAVLAVPDLVMLLHQRAETGYLPVPWVGLTVPLAQLTWLALAHPGDVALPILACVAAVLSGWRRPDDDSQRGADAVWMVAGAFLLLMLLLAAASYRQSILVDHVVLSLTPLGLVGAGIYIADVLVRGRRLAAAIWVQVAVTTMLLSALFMVDAVKTNTDQVARYITAESRQDDFVLLVPGAPGASFNWYVGRNLSQIDYPVVGAVGAYRFDHGFERVADTVALRVTMDSIRAVRAAGRRVWFIYPAGLKPGGPTPEILTADSFAWAGKAPRSRATRLQQELKVLYPAPEIVVAPQLRGWSMEMLAVELYDQSRR